MSPIKPRISIKTVDIDTLSVDSSSINYWKKRGIKLAHLQYDNAMPFQISRNDDGKLLIGNIGFSDTLVFSKHWLRLIFFESARSVRIYKRTNKLMVLSENVRWIGLRITQEDIILLPSFLITSNITIMGCSETTYF